MADQHQLPQSSLPDLCMVDAEREQTFSLIGSKRNIFSRIADWKNLKQELLIASKELRQTESIDRWRELTGDEYYEGEPFCHMRSPLAREVVTRLAEDDGGLLWEDKDGENWAVRLFPAKHSDDWIGISVNFPIKKLRLDRRAEQIVWLLHSLVLRQRSSEVVVADQTIGRVIWGGNKGNWPKAWRREVKSTIRSLRRLHFELLRIPSCGWEPRLGSFGAALIGFTDAMEASRITGATESCDECCELYGSSVSHHHFVFQIGPNFLGALEHFATHRTADGVRKYQFSGNELPLPKPLEEYRSQGGLVSVHLPSRIYGPARWADLPPQRRNVLNGILAETTRASRSKRPDRGHIVRDALVPNWNVRRLIKCPFLDTSLNYVAFGGNGRFPGRGYRIIGDFGTGWLHKCGLQLNDDFSNAASVTRKLFAELRPLECRFGFRAVAVTRNDQWHSLSSLGDLAATDFGYEVIDEFHLRFYAPADYLDRIRDYYRELGDFCPLGLGITEGKVEGTSAEMSLAARIKQSGLTQVVVAQQLGCSQPFLSNLLNGRKAWPDGLEDEILGILGSHRQRS